MIKLYILIRKDINVSVGKLMVHVGHVCTSLAFDYGDIYEYEEWFDTGITQTKIILSVKNLQQLKKYIEKAKSLELPNEIIADTGFYEVDAGTIILGCILCRESEAKEIGLKRLSLFKYELGRPIKE